MAEAARLIWRTEAKRMGTKGLTMTAAGVGAAAVLAAALVFEGAPEQPAATTGDAALAARVSAALDEAAAGAAAHSRTASARDESAGEIAAAAVAALGAARDGNAGEEAVAASTQADGTGEGAAVGGGMPTPQAAAAEDGFRLADAPPSPVFAIAASARPAAEAGWVAASGAGPVTIELRPMPRPD